MNNPSNLQMISPAYARELLDTYNTNNRSVRPKKVSEYRRAIALDQWVDNPHNLIMIGSDKVLIDGQHRLLAIAGGTKSVPMRIVWDVDPIVQAVTDINIKRTIGDMRGFENWKFKSTHIATARMLLLTRDNHPAYDKHYTYTNQEIADYMISHAEEFKHMNDSISGGSSQLQIVQIAMCLFGIQAIREHGWDDCVDLFMQGLINGNDLYPQDPRLIARKWFEANRREERKWTQHYSTLVKSFNYWLKGDTLARIHRWNPEGENAADKFPKILGRNNV